MAKFTITKSSDFDYFEEKEINTLEELLEFVDKNGSIIIFESTITNPYKTSRLIEIYDAWRE